MMHVNPSQKESQEEIAEEEERTVIRKTGRWSDDEHERFLEGLLIFGKNWDQVVAHIGTRDPVNVRSHSQKFFFKLIKYLEGEEGIEEISNAERYLDILQTKRGKPKDETSQQLFKVEKDKNAVNILKG